MAVLVVAVAGEARAATAQEYFEQGNEAYLRDDLDAAIAVWRKVPEMGFENAAVHYNLGNAHLKAGRLGWAILYYEKALKLAPRDEDIRTNLARARERVVDKVVGAEGEEGGGAGAIAAWDRVFSAFSADTAAWLFLVPYVVLFALLTGLRFVRAEALRRPMVVACVPLAVLALAAGALLAGKAYTDEAIELGVVLAPVAGVREGPDENFKASFEVHEGLKVRVRAREAGWVRIALMNGLHGWVPRDAIGGI